MKSAMDEPTDPINNPPAIEAKRQLLSKSEITIAEMNIAIEVIKTDTSKKTKNKANFFKIDFFFGCSLFSSFFISGFFIAHQTPEDILSQYSFNHSSLKNIKHLTLLEKIRKIIILSLL